MYKCELCGKDLSNAVKILCNPQDFDHDLMSIYFVHRSAHLTESLNVSHKAE